MLDLLFSVLTVKGKAMLQKVSWSIVFLVLFLCQALAQTQPYTPERGTPERQAITDALRLSIQKPLHTKVIFKIDHLKVQNGWAFLRGVPQQADGSAVNYRGTPYESAVAAGAFDDGIVALLRKRGKNWQVVKYVIGATDVPYVDWNRKYHAPSAIFTED
jgi:hypothetical protein